MLLQLEKIVEPQELQRLREGIARAEYVDGAGTAGHAARSVKHNRQLRQDTPLAAELGAIVLASVRRSPAFISAALPKRISPPMFNRHEAGMTYGNHVDNALLGQPRLRTDIAATLFLTDPAAYDGGELVIQDSYGLHSAKLQAGNLLIYPASSVHRVQPVTRGVRDAAVFWVESMVRDERQRRLLFDLDNTIQRLTAANAGNAETGSLMACYHNLLRMWAES